MKWLLALQTHGSKGQPLPFGAPLRGETHTGLFFTRLVVGKKWQRTNACLDGTRAVENVRHAFVWNH